jgi:hypothetical protein
MSDSVVRISVDSPSYCNFVEINLLRLKKESEDGSRDLAEIMEDIHNLIETTESEESMGYFGSREKPPTTQEILLARLHHLYYRLDRKIKNRTQSGWTQR